jgi:transposase
MRGNRDYWTVDFNQMPLDEAALYERPFEYVKDKVYPERVKSKTKAERWCIMAQGIWTLGQAKERLPDPMKKVYSPAFKAQVVLELLKEEKTLAQLSSEHGVHVTVLREWKVIALKGLASLFERRDKSAEQAAAHDKQVEELYAEIGRLTTQVNWLKKKLPS